MIGNQKEWEEMAAALKAAQGERDALAAQVACQQALLKCWQTWLGSSRESCDDSGAKLWDKIEEACSTTPQPHLNEVRAQAIEDVVVASGNASQALRVPVGYYHSEAFLLQYAASIRGNAS